jgi:general secretion pathway protein D
MRCTARLFAIPISLLLALQSASAATAADSARQPGSQNIQYRHRTRPRAYRHAQENVAAVPQEATAQRPAITTDPKAPQTDPPPAQVMIEAAIVELALTPEYSDSGVNLARLAGTATQPGAAVQHAAINVLTGFSPAAVATDAETASTATRKADAVKSFAFVHGKTADTLRMLQSMGETKVLACPRIMTLHRQLADIQIGTHLPYQEVKTKDGVTTAEYKPIFIGTELRVRPFVSADGMIRLEVFAGRSTGHVDAAGVPQTNAIQISANVNVPDGTTVAFCDKPRTEVEQSRAPLLLLNCLPGPLPLLGWIPYPDSLSPSPYRVEHRQLVVLLSPQIVRK